MLETLLSNRTVSVLWEALPRILSAGLTMTIPLTLVSFTTDYNIKRNISKKERQHNRHRVK